MASYNKTILNNPAEIYLSSIQSPRSAKNIEWSLSMLCNCLVENSCYVSFDWSTINFSMLLDLRKILFNKGLKPNSINTYLSLFKGVARECWRHDHIKTKEYLLIQDVKRVKGFRLPAGRALENDEIQNLIKCCSRFDKTVGTRNAAIVAVMFGAGLRAHELVSLNVSNFDGKNVSVIGKGNKERLNPLPEPSIKALNKWLKVRGKHDGAIFSKIARGGSINDKALASCSLRGILKKVMDKGNINRFTPHDLRRSYATNLLENEVDVFIVKDLMGHNSIESTKIYDRRGVKAKAEAVKLLRFA